MLAKSALASEIQVREAVQIEIQKFAQRQELKGFYSQRNRKPNTIVAKRVTASILRPSVTPIKLARHTAGTSEWLRTRMNGDMEFH